MGKIKRIIEYVKNLFNKENNNKWGENLIILIIIGVIVIIAGGTLFGDNDKKKNESLNKDENENVKLVGNMGITDDKSELEKNMEEILAQINGVGKVTVMITYVSGKEIVPVTDIKRNDNNTDEKDSAGGTRKSVQSSFESSIAYEEVNSGVKKPIIAKELLPQVKGVVVVADGASDVTVKESLVSAVQVLLDVPIHKVQVFERGK
ncbi:MAG: stage III sporulation protein AG [Bacillota bacterium]